MKARILVLEDDSEFRAMLVSLLGKEGYQVDGASRGSEALELAKQSEYDLVVTDIRMEGQDGLDTLSQLKAEQPFVQSLVMTGYSSEEDSIRAVRLGVGDYLRKPFRLDDFVGAVRRLVGERQRRHQISRERVAVLRSLRRLCQKLGAEYERRHLPVASRAGAVAAQLCAAARLAPDTEEVARLLTLLAALDDAGDRVYEPDDLPTVLQLGLLHLEERWDGTGTPDGLVGSQIPIESRVASLALAAGRQQALAEGSFDPVLVALLKRPRASGESSPQVAPKGLRSLLSLASAMQASGDLGAAEAALSEIARLRAPTREGVEARLALGRLAGQRGDLNELTELLRQASSMADQVGPSVSAQAHLDAGILTAQSGLPGAEASLAEAVRLFRGARSAAGTSLALLANAALVSRELPLETQETCLRTLLGSQYAGELGAAASWLLPFLWPAAERESEPFLTVLRRLRREAPREWESFAASLEVVDRQRLEAIVPAAPGPEASATQDPRSSPEILAPPLLRIHSLGPFEVYHGSSRVGEGGWRSQKARYLLSFLAAAGRAVPEDKIVDEFWPDEFEKGKRNLYWCTSVLRGKLRLENWPQVDYIGRSGGALTLTSEFAYWHDLDELDRQFSQARQHQQTGNSTAATDAYRRMIGLYRGPYMEGCYMPWTDPIRKRVEDQVTAALLYLLAVSSGQGRPEEVLELAASMLEIDPCCQEAYAASMAAHISVGRPEKAIRLFSRCVEVLDEELGIEPGEELLALRQSLPG